MRRRNDRWLRDRLLELAREHPRFGYRRLHVFLGRENVTVNHNKVQRVYGELGLMVKRNRHKRLARVLRPRPVLTAPNLEWLIDFTSDVTASGRRLRVLSVLDSFTKQSQARGNLCAANAAAHTPKTGSHACAHSRGGCHTLYTSAFFERRKKDYMDLLLSLSTQGAWEYWIRFWLQGVTYSFPVKA
jgi:hypothetical protein